MKIVEEIVTGHDRAQRIFDPFCGTGTTALCAATHGRESVTTDLNPFLVWLARAKTARYSAEVIDETRNACAHAIDLTLHRAIEPVPAPPIANIERWWSADDLDFLRLLRAAIDHATHSDTEARSLLLVAFCRALMRLSNAAFNHQSMSFKDDEQLTLPLEIDKVAIFETEVRFVLRGAVENPVGSASVMLADARKLRQQISGTFDLVVTSPPYANRMSYIRELRPYMYWLGFLSDGRAAGELDWQTIGGTWGVATSRLANWERSERQFNSAQLTRVLREIAHPDHKNGMILSKYVAKYIDDMWAHFCELTGLLSAGAEIHYIVGNSTFYGVLVPTEHLFAEMLAELGFSHVECRPIRKRNSNKSLIEFDVVARWK
ncbi:DNA adenine methylase [Chloroflexus sp.]|uniref:DNA adenine methylase n=1 Tax=Chloroflexus sp. TaxID=1904827 RepID=UPI002621950E|nr:DNA adenine methylase [uncultured Chloroflexus sp.]